MRLSPPSLFGAACGSTHPRAAVLACAAALLLPSACAARHILVEEGSFDATATFFEEMGADVGGCGFPRDKAVDDNGRPLPFVALNTASEFDGGANCGRWVEIQLGKNCKGAGNSQWSVCDGGSYEADEITGTTIHGYVSDSCADANFWCQTDTYHLDISRAYLDSLGVSDGWNGRQVSWSYLSDTPDGWDQSDGPKFMFKDGSKWLPNGKGFWVSLVVYNIADGIGSVEQNIGGAWVPLEPLDHLRQQWVLQEPQEYRGYSSRSFPIRVTGLSGQVYSETTLPWKCGDSACDSYVDTP